VWTGRTLTRPAGGFALMQSGCSLAVFSPALGPPLNGWQMGRRSLLDYDALYDRRSSAFAPLRRSQPSSRQGRIMKIESLQTLLYRIPLPPLISDAAHGTVSHFEQIVVAIQAAGGLEGTGFTYTIGTGGGALSRMVEEDVAPLVLGQDPRRTEHLWALMWRHLHYVGRGGLSAYAMSAVDIALWDLKARLFREPLWRLLGGHDPCVEAYASGTNLDYPVAKLLEQNRAFVERGYRAVKLKLGRPRLAEDLERVALLRRELGDDVRIMADANMGWSVDEAIRAARALARYDVFWLEEPTDPDDVAGNVRVEREGNLPVSMGENYHTLHEFQRLFGAGGIAFPSVDVTNVGGVTPFLKIAHLAEGQNRRITVHGIEELHAHLLVS